MRAAVSLSASFRSPPLFLFYRQTAQASPTKRGSRGGHPSRPAPLASLSRLPPVGRVYPFDALPPTFIDLPLPTQGAPQASTPSHGLPPTAVFAAARAQSSTTAAAARAARSSVTPMAAAAPSLPPPPTQTAASPAWASPASAAAPRIARVDASVSGADMATNVPANTGAASDRDRVGASARLESRPTTLAEATGLEKRRASASRRESAEGATGGEVVPTKEAPPAAAPQPPPPSRGPSPPRWAATPSARRRPRPATASTAGRRTQFGRRDARQHRQRRHCARRPPAPW